MNITKIAHKLWEVVGLALAVLFLLGILATFIGIGYAIYQYKTHHVEGVAVEPKEDKGKLKVTVEYGLPLPLEGTDYLMIPVKLEKKKHGQEREAVQQASYRRSSYDNYDSSMSSSLYYPYWGPYYNLVFINKTTGESRPLLPEKGYIDGVYLPEKKYGYDKEKAETNLTFVFLKIATKDTNHDGVINEKDASAGFLTSVDGSKLTQITPDGTQMRWWHYDSDSHRLFVEILHDANKDNKFNWDDPQTVISINVLDPKIGQEFVPAEIKNKIESVLIKK